MKRFADILKKEILKGLPGTKVQWEMASSDRMIRKFPRLPGEDARVAAVLILLYPYNDSIHTVLMQRHDYNGVHGGQISLPGGKQEAMDKSITETAVREANEETGVNKEAINLIGTLTPLFIPVSNMIVTPVVAWTNEKPVFNHQPEEVVFLFDADIKKLLNSSSVKTKPMDIHGEIINVKYFDYEGNVIWGATAMILNEFLTLINRAAIPVSI